MTAAAALLAALERRGWSLAVAESLTGGALAATIVDTPGASRTFRGGVVAYDTAVKRRLLGVDADLLAAHGAVHPEVARQMAERVRRVVTTDLGATDVGIATTGVAGPTPQDGQPVGRVHIAIATPGVTKHLELDVPGHRSQVRAAVVQAAIDLARRAVDVDGHP